MTALALALALAAQVAPAGAAPAKTASGARTAVAPAPVPSARVHTWTGLAIAPTGDWFAAVEPIAGKAGTALVVRSVATGRVLRTIEPAPGRGIVGTTVSARGDLAWLAPDIVGAVGAAKVPTQIVVADARGGQHVVASVPGLVQSLRFSPGGDRLAALVVLNPSKETGATQAGARQVGEIGETSDEQRLAVFAVRGETISAGGVRPLSPPDRYIYEYDWTPDGAGFVVTSALGNGDNNWWVATLDHVDAATGTVRPIARPTTQLNFPRVSPDGRSVAYIGGLMSDFGSVGGDVWTVPIGGGTPTDVTRGAPMTFQSLAWTRAGLRAVALHGDRQEIVAIAPGKAMAVGFSQPVTLAASGFDKAAFATNGMAVATIAQDYTHAPAVYAGQSLTPVQVTHDNDAVPAAVAARSVTWRNEGYTIQGWLLSPLGADPTIKSPMIVQVHGGPSAATTPRFVEHGAATEYTDAGYHLFYPNPRGSYGQGEAFTAANKRDFGGGDLRDILAGVDAVEKVAPIDDSRLGLAGCSYGGFMAMWANTQTNRFKAIVAGAGLSNFVSYYGTNGIDQWLIPFYGKSVYDDYRIYEDASAVYHVGKAHTPTFIYVGERDIEVPPTQSIEWWHALKAKNVPVSLVVYPDAGHCVPRADQNADVRQRALAWFGKYLR